MCVCILVYICLFLTGLTVLLAIQGINVRTFFSGTIFFRTSLFILVNVELTSPGVVDNCTAFDGHSLYKYKHSSSVERSTVAS